MKINKLKLNDKTEMLVIIFLCHPNMKQKMPSISFRIGDSSIVPTKSVRNLGAIIII